MGSPGGFQINPGLYRVPDLLTEEQFVEYMRTTFGVKVTFDHGDKDAPSPARALGQSRTMGPVAEDFDVEDMTPPEIRDPILRNLNERNFGPDYASTVSEEDVEKAKEAQQPKTTTRTTSTATKK